MGTTPEDPTWVTHWSDNGRCFGKISPLGEIGCLGMPFFYIRAPTASDALTKLMARVKQVIKEAHLIGFEDHSIVGSSCRPAYFGILEVDNKIDIGAGHIPPGRKLSDEEQLDGTWNRYREISVMMGWADPGPNPRKRQS